MSGAKSLFAKGGSKPPSVPEEISAFLGKETSFEGKMTFQGVFRLEGRFEGEIFESGTLIVGESALIKGKVGVHIHHHQWPRGGRGLCQGTGGDPFVRKILRKPPDPDPDHP